MGIVKTFDRDRNIQQRAVFCPQLRKRFIALCRWHVAPYRYRAHAPVVQCLGNVSRMLDVNGESNPALPVASDNDQFIASALDQFGNIRHGR
jgi:hypothetical protein